MTIDEIQEATMADEELQTLIQSIRTGKWNKQCKYYAVRQELSVTQNGVILRGTKLVMPNELRKRTIKLAHQGHQGIVKTKQALRTKVWWPAMGKMAEDYVKRCHACQSLGQGDPPPPMQRTAMPDKPWSVLHMDFCGPFPNGETVLVVIDAYSRFPEVEIMKSTSAKSVMTKLDRMFATHGLPDEIRSDNGPPFTSREINNYMKERGIRHRRVTPLWPQANGEAEAFMKPLGKAIKAAKLEGKNWKEELYGFLLAYRTTPHSVTGVAPSQLLFNREVRTNVPAVVVTTTKGKINYKKMHEKAQKNTQERKTKAREYADTKRRVKESKIKIGDVVLVKQEKKNKFTTPFDPKPLKVIAIKGTMVTAKRVDKEISRNISHFKRFVGNSRAPDGEKEISDKELDEEITIPPREAAPRNIPRRYPRRQPRRPQYLEEQHSIMLK